MSAASGKQQRPLLGLVGVGLAGLLAGLPAVACSHPQARPAPIPIPLASSSLASEVGQSGEKTEPTPVSEGEKLEPPVTDAEREELAEKAEAGKPVTVGAATPADAEMLSKPAAPAEPTKPGVTAEAAKPAVTAEAKPAAAAEAKPAVTAAAAKPVATADEAKPASTAEAAKPVATADESKAASTTEAAKPEAAKPVTTADESKPASTSDVTKPGMKEPSETRGPLVTDTGAPAPTQPPPVASPPDRPASPSALQLKPGAVKMIQQRLAIAGVLSEVQTSGAMDPPTRAALMRYQQANALPVTGEPDDATIRKLGLRSENIFEP
jgi:hypothetical protein